MIVIPAPLCASPASMASNFQCLVNASRILWLTSALSTDQKINVWPASLPTNCMEASVSRSTQAAPVKISTTNLAMNADSEKFL